MRRNAVNEGAVRTSAPRAANPLEEDWAGPFGLPPFATVVPEHFAPAFAVAMERHRSEIDAIAGAPAEPTFDNTIAALEASGRQLERIADLFFNLAAAHTSEALQEVEREIAPKLAAHRNAVLLDARLFARIDDLHGRRDGIGLDAEQKRVIELQHLEFVRAGARLDATAKARVGEIRERLAALATAFSQNVLKDEQSWRLVLDGEDDLAGLPGPVRAAAARGASDMGLEGKHVVTLARSSVEAFLQFSARRDLREEAFRAWVRRGETGGETDNSGILVETVALRAELARLLGYETFAAYSLAETMAKTPAAVRGLLDEVWPRAIARVAEERAALQALVEAEGGNFEIAPWDWRFYAEKQRKARYDIDDAEIRPYLQLDNVIEAAFDCASRLFGLRFRNLPDLPTYHPDVRAWEVTDTSGRHVGLFLGDYFARPSKRSGAWMSSLRGQHKLDGEVRPIIVNVMNFARGAEGAPTLLSFDDARTLFHEFGHGLHGLLSDVTYPSITGTNVVRDFVELPSQLYEHWLMRPEVLQRFALHAETGAPMPQQLMRRVEAARHFNQGFTTVEYMACACLDMALHELTHGMALDVSDFERTTLDRLGMPREIVPRHRLPHFLHVMGGYAAGYYSYLWSEVMDADAFAAFEEADNIFDAETARRLEEHIYAAGNRRDPLEAYVAFRGRPPHIEPLLRKRGFVPDESTAPSTPRR